MIDRLKFTLTPPLKDAVPELSNPMLNCEAQGSLVTVWKRVGKTLSQNHVVYPNGTLFLSKVTKSDAGSYTCEAKNYRRTIKATTVVEVFSVS